MAYSRVSYVGDNTTTEFTIPFPFLRVDSLQVRVNDLLKTLGTDYTINPSTGKVIFAAPPVVNYPVDIKRVTPRTAEGRIVKFTDPSDIRADVLNNADLQLLYIVQEALDDIADGLGVGYPVGDPDPDAPLPTNVQNALDGLNTEFVNQLLAETNARAAAILAEHNDRVAALLGETNARTAAIASEQTARQSADSSLASSIGVINAALSDPNTGLAKAHARVTAEETARATADSATAARVTTLESAVNNPSGGLSNLAARLTTVEGALTGGNSNEALAFRISTLESTVSGHGDSLSTLTSRIAVEESTRSNADGALSARVATVESSVGTLSASVTSEASARATADGQLGAEYVLAVATNGPGGARRITGFRVTNYGGAGGGTEFVVQTDRFILVNSSGEGARIPFQVVGGLTYIDEAVIQTLNAGKIRAGTISGQEIVLGTNGATLATLRSANYVPGISGFTLRSDGYFECGNGVFRGQIVAGSLITLDESETARFAFSTFQTDGTNVGLKLGYFRTGDHATWVDFRSDDANQAGSGYSARIIREAGTNAVLKQFNLGSGGFEFYAVNGGDYRFIDNAGQRLRFGSFTSSFGGDIEGYIIVKSDDGVERKLAVIS